VTLLEEYISELTQDVQIDEFNMKDVQLKLPAIKHKWTGRLMRSKMEIDAKYRQKHQLIEKVADALIQESPVSLSVPMARKTAEDHVDVKKIQDEIKELRLVVEFLEKTEKTLSSITFDIKNIVEIIKLETQ
tara:strand:+ start:303 stop:698 length:396 start_codon:yes stop_codon:yes gene_type:complete